MLRSINISPHVIVAALAWLATSASAAVVGTIETFDVDAAGFQGSTTSTVQIHAANDGNPDGHIQIRKDLSPPVFDIGSRNSANPGFLGDYGAAGVTGAGFDLNVFNSTLDNVFLRFRRAVNENGWLFPFGAVLPNANQWESHDVMFDPTWDDVTAAANGWLTDQDLDAAADPSPAFADVMAAVDWIEVRLASEGSTVAGIDNVRLVPEPSSLIALGLGAMGLRWGRKI